jgi:hypothetical protein
VVTPHGIATSSITSEPLRTVTKPTPWLYGDRLRMAVGPKDAIEELYVRNAADYAWDAFRLRRMRARILRSSRTVGLLPLLNDRFQWPSERTSLLNSWACGERKAIREVTNLLKASDLDESDIDAQTFLALVDQIEQLDRMIGRADDCLVTFLRELDRRRDVFVTRMRSGISEAVENAEYEEVQPGPENS